jgi:FkbH-like protein
MNVTEALSILRDAPKEARPFHVTLACGFVSLHLQTFLAAYLQQALPERHVVVFPGLYGNLAATVEQSAEAQRENVVIAIEWADLDPRLGYRSSWVWDSVALADILSSARNVLRRLTRSIRGLAPGAKTVLSMPTLPLPPLFPVPAWRTDAGESTLIKMAAEFSEELVGAGIAVVNATCLGEHSAFDQRYDFKSDLLLGLPYTLRHADVLASALSRLLCPPAAKKGIITDLDDTLWSGLLGEIGPDEVHWDLAGHSQIHALYQSLLSSLADSGILVAVASRNDQELVQRAFDRPDILLRRDAIFPMEVHWGAKSRSVDRILASWNISADSVVFVDDSAMELAEVAAGHPGIECIQFVGRDYPAAYALLRRIRELFAKASRSSEDSIRLASIRKSAEFERSAAESTGEDFLRELKAVVHFDFDRSTNDVRALELVNKTNQFNLNGVRYTESDWIRELSRPNTCLMAASYEDRFGRLGKIAVMLGSLVGDTLRIHAWVMSCRAFGRRIEHLCLRTCFERHPISRIQFDYTATSRNKPLQEFISSLLGQQLQPHIELTKEEFERACPPTLPDSRGSAEF